jgi:hypothetical protein
MRQILFLNAIILFCVSNLSPFDVSELQKRQNIGYKEKNKTLKYGEKYEAAAYINDRDKPRPDKKDKDFPDLKVKPADVDIGHYDNKKSQAQHKFCPYVRIKTMKPFIVSPTKRQLLA